jgi:hypothetical protein
MLRLVSLVRMLIDAIRAQDASSRPTTSARSRVSPRPRPPRVLDALGRIGATASWRRSRA